MQQRLCSWSQTGYGLKTSGVPKMPRILTVRACVREPRETLRILKNTKNNFKDLHARGTCPGVVYGFHSFDWHGALIFRRVHPNDKPKS